MHEWIRGRNAKAWAGILLAGLVGIAGVRLHERYAGSCCYPGAPCCHLGSPCCHGHQQPLARQ